MAAKKTGISPDLLIHPGETIADILIERNITQVELAVRTGVTAAYVSNIIAGKKDISAKFAHALEYALDVPKSFWLNLQANYDAELLELTAEQTISDHEMAIRNELSEVIKYLQHKGQLPAQETKAASVLSLRKVLGISDISKLEDIVPAGVFRMNSAQSINPHVLGAWIRLCQTESERRTVPNCYDNSKINLLIHELKELMCHPGKNLPIDLHNIFAQYGIDFSIAHNFRGAPVQGYLSQKNDGSYQMTLTIRGAFADIFWFSLFHELGHLTNGDIGRSNRFLDVGIDEQKEKNADLFASNQLIHPEAYDTFIRRNDFSIHAITELAASQHIMPYIVIGRLQKERHLDYNQYYSYKLRYKWSS